ncbi:hypothetical protein [Streptomyces sp. WAC06614]|uniref:hypothetical protein n=1 Tax=Streptomyces sp. WAC06614 TaxID=2487416 RepID=UPI000F78D46E|nr:hypothetical protein [Streptomyces sp. WAC06614]RSS83193.1 hypothetical protein EF918_04625 [Streptomyces sp. WAC06614]
MLTLHTADLALPGPAGDPVPGGAVLVRGAVVEAVGRSEDLAAAWPGARVRRWPGLLAPGLVHARGVELLEETYHPDPREAEDPLPAPTAQDTARWGGSARRGVQRLLAHGVVAVAGTLRHRWAAEAVTRSGLTLLPATATASRAPGADPAEGPTALDPALPALAPGSSAPVVSLDPLAGLGAAVPLPFHGGLVPGAPARFAVFAVPDEPALRAAGAGTCVATVVAGRLLHRRR